MHMISMSRTKSFQSKIRFGYYTAYYSYKTGK